MNYFFILRNEKTKNYRLVSQLLVFFNLLGFVFLLIKNEEAIRNNLWLMFAIIATTVYSLFAIIERAMKKPVPDFWHRSILAYCAVAWLRTDLWWLFIIILFFIGLDFLALKKQVVKISDKTLFLPAMFEKKVEWQELNNVILKDGLLTIDFKNNKLFQQLILNSDWDVDEQQFNDFCQKQLNK